MLRRNHEEEGSALSNLSPVLCLSPVMAVVRPGMIPYSKTATKQAEFFLTSTGALAFQMEGQASAWEGVIG
jgi:hypothetical protein